VLGAREEEKQSANEATKPTIADKHIQVKSPPTRVIHTIFLSGFTTSFIHSLYITNNNVIHTFISSIDTLCEGEKFQIQSTKQDGFNYNFSVFLYPPISDQWTLPSQEFYLPSPFSHFLQVCLFFFSVIVRI